MMTIKIREEFDGDGFSYELDIHQFSEYLYLTEKRLDDAVKSKQIDFETISEHVDYKALYGNDDAYLDFIDKKVYSNIQSLYYSSLFISACSLFETKLLELCRVAEIKTDTKVEDFCKMNKKQKNGEELHKKIYPSVCFDYLIKGVGIKHFELISSYYDTIQKYTELRNFLVHTANEFIPMASNRVSVINNIPMIGSITECYKDIDNVLCVNYKIEDSSPITDLLNNISNLFYYLYYREV